MNSIAIDVTRTTIVPREEPREECSATTAHAQYRGSQLSHGDWIYTVSVNGDYLSLYGRDPSVLAEPYASELRAFRAACEGK